MLFFFVNNNSCLFHPDLNLLDWSSQNLLAVALHNSVYLWDATRGDITLLMTLEREEDYVCSLSWTKEGSYLAVGTSDSNVQVGRMWDTSCHWGNDRSRDCFLNVFAFVSPGVGHRKSQVSPQHEGPFSQSVQLELERLHPVKVKLLPPSWLVQQCERVSLTKYSPLQWLQIGKNPSP